MQGLRLLLLVAAAAVGGAGAQCAEGWVEVEGRCYGLVQATRTNWSAARDYCAAFSADTAIIYDANVLRALYEYIVDYQLSGSFWLGASDETAEGNWLWRNNIRVDRGTPFWALHKPLLGGYTLEPQGGEAENCLALAEDRFYFLDDRNCTELYYPLCEL